MGSPLMGASSAGGVGKHRDSRRISGFGIDHCCTVACRLHFDGGVQVIALIRRPFKKWYCIVFRDQQTPLRHASVNIVYDTKLRCYAEDETTERNLIVRIGKSKAEVTNNKRVRSSYCTVETNY